MSANWKGCMQKRMGALLRDQRGITGLETAIVLIAFVVVAAVFAFTVLTTGLFTSEKAKETALAGLAASSATLAVRGSVTATSACGGAGGACEDVDMIRVKIATAAGVDSVGFDPTTVLVTYQDENVAELLAFDEDVLAAAPAECNGPLEWCIRWSPNIVAAPRTIIEPGDVAELLIMPPDGADPLVALGANKQFRIEIIPQQGSALVLSRRTPLTITAVMNLD